MPLRETGATSGSAPPPRGHGLADHADVEKTRICRVPQPRRPPKHLRSLSASTGPEICSTQGTSRIQLPAETVSAPDQSPKLLQAVTVGHSRQVIGDRLASTHVLGPGLEAGRQSLRLVDQTLKQRPQLLLGLVTLRHHLRMTVDLLVEEVLQLLFLLLATRTRRHRHSRSTGLPCLAEVLPSEGRQTGLHHVAHLGVDQLMDERATESFALQWSKAIRDISLAFVESAAAAAGHPASSSPSFTASSTSWAS